MQRFLLSLLPVAGSVLLVACGSPGSSANSAFALVGTPGRNSPIASANFLISGNTCNYYTYRGDGTTPAQATKSCTVLEDKSNALGHAHVSMKIGFSTDKGQQVLTLNQASNTTMAATSVPDIGMYLPTDWTIAAPAPNMVLNSTAPSTAYSGVAIHIEGVGCSMTVTPVSDNTPTSLPCGLIYWSDSSFTIAMAGALVSSTVANQTWTLRFYKNTGKAAEWNVSPPLVGFPATFSEASSTSN